jgi:hypothetical protein
MISGSKEEGVYAAPSLESRIAQLSVSQKATIALLCNAFDLKLTHEALDRVEKLSGPFDRELLAALRG